VLYRLLSFKLHELSTELYDGDYNPLINIPLAFVCL